MATAKGRMVLPLALAVGATGLMVMTSIAGATHPRPAGATPLRVSLVPAYNPCALAQPHARAAARVPLLQPAGAELELPDGRHARRERRAAQARSASFTLGQFHDAVRAT